VFFDGPHCFQRSCPFGACPNLARFNPPHPPPYPPASPTLPCGRYAKKTYAGADLDVVTGVCDAGITAAQVTRAGGNMAVLHFDTPTEVAPRVSPFEGSVSPTAVANPVLADAVLGKCSSGPPKARYNADEQQAQPVKRVTRVDVKVKPTASQPREWHQKATTREQLTTFSQFPAPSTRVSVSIAAGRRGGSCSGLTHITSLPKCRPTSGAVQHLPSNLRSEQNLVYVTNDFPSSTACIDPSLIA